MERTWKFSITKEHGPMWDMYEGDKLVAYARRAEDGGWFVRISELNSDYFSDKLHIGADTDPVNFMNIMCELHKKDKP